jgi:hypothetical protein
MDCDILGLTHYYFVLIIIGYLANKRPAKNDLQQPEYSGQGKYEDLQQPEYSGQGKFEDLHQPEYSGQGKHVLGYLQEESPKMQLV